MAFIMGKMNLADRLGAPPSRDSPPRKLRLRSLLLKLGERILMLAMVVVIGFGCVAWSSMALMWLRAVVFVWM
jgi:hypothetical protein